MEGRGGADIVLHSNDYWSSGAPFKIVWNGKAYGAPDAFQTAITPEHKTTNKNIAVQDRNAKNGDTAINLNMDPLLEAPGSGGTLDNADQLASIKGYRLRPNSPLIGKGENLPIYQGIRSGERDFYGTRLPQGHDYSIGACEHKQ